MVGDETELRIEERRASLALEKTLSGHHRALAALMGQFEHYGDDDVADALRSALWSLGVAILRHTEARRRL